jgi:signal transduction histidine kinase
MRLRSRLILGLLNIAVLLLVPLVIALRALDELHVTTQALRTGEFAASLMLSRVRAQTDAAAAVEVSHVVQPTPETGRLLATEVARLQSVTDSLRVLTRDATASDVAQAVRRVARIAADEVAPSISTAALDTLSERQMVPALGRVHDAIGRAERALTVRITERVDNATAATEDAWRTAGWALAIALGLVILVATWLTSTISRPIRDLEVGMKKVASGEFGHQLTVAPRRDDEFGRLAASYQSMARQLAELDKLKAEFVSVASHELKTPLNVILGYLQLLEEGLYGQLNEQQLEVLATIEAQCQSLNRLVKQLLDVSRFEAGGGKLEPRTIKLDLFLRELESAFKVLAMQRGVNFQVTRDPALPETVFWDEDRMNEVLGNLLSNAFKFTDRGGRVELGVFSVPSGVTMEVRDTGAGIAPDQLPYVFEKFYQADNQSAAAAKGTGLGLAIAKEIVEAHRGTITVHSALGHGTTFTITLPSAAPAGWRRSPRRSLAIAAPR